MNGLKNGLYDGLLTGQANGLFDGLDNGLHNGLFSNESPYLDLDAQKFINAIGTLTNQQSNIINILVIQLKYYKIWNRFKAIYPFIGGTASSHKFNLINPLDTNAAYRLTFTGGWTHSQTGALPNGTNAFADTNYDFINFKQNSTHISYYSRTNNTQGGIDMGVNSSGQSSLNAYLYSQFHNPSLLKAITTNNSIATDYLLETTFTNTLGFLINNRTSSTIVNIFRNKTKTSSTLNSVSLVESRNLYIGARNNGVSGANNFTNRECSFATFGTGLTDIDALNLYYIVQNYQILLNRAV